MKRNILLGIFTLAFVAVMAQERIKLTGVKKNQDTQVSVENYDVTITDQKTLVTMDFVLDSMRVKSARYRAFTPILRSKDGSQEQRFKSLLITGRVQDVIFDRDGIDPLYADNYQAVRRDKEKQQSVSYSDVIDRLPWHQGAELWVECDLCGCGDLLKSDYAFLGKTEIIPVFCFVDVVPAPDSKIRDLHGTAFINFIVDRWEMRPDYMDNYRELRKITDTLDVMTNDPNIHVDKVKIHGWASPESPYEHNRMLATNRAKSLTEYVKHIYNLPDSVFATPEATPENWIGLRKAVEEMSTATLPHRAEILAMIDDNTIAPDPKEAQIKRKYPQEYQYLLKNVYPHLRRSDYEITFRYEKFSLEKAKMIYEQGKYHQLSARELWDIANTYSKETNEYVRAIQIAHSLYPDSTAVTINLTNIALRQDDLQRAETLLKRAGDSAEAENARAILYMKQRRYAEAEEALKRAQKKGLDVTENLRTLQEIK